MSSPQRIPKVLRLPIGEQAAATSQRPEGVRKTVGIVTEVGLDASEVVAIRRDERRKAYERFAAAVTDLEAADRADHVDAVMRDGVTRYPQWEAMERAYQSMRLTWVSPRRGRPKGLTTKHDPTLDRWVRERDAFRDFFYGIERGGKRAFLGVRADIAEVIQTYSRLRDKWRRRTPEHRARNAKHQAASRARQRALRAGK